VVPFINRWFFGQVIDTIESTLREAEYDLVLYNLGDEAGRARFFEEMPLRKRVDAIVIASLVLSEEEFAALDGLGLPVGLLGVDRPGYVSTRIDDAAAARTAVEHLLSLGHTHIGLIGGDTADPMRFTPPHHRQRGYRAALEAAGLTPDPTMEVLGYFTVDGGRAAAETLLALPERPTAIFAESDEMAYGAIRALRTAGLRVPHDVAVIGFDDHVHSELMDLSTVRQPVAEQARDLTLRLLGELARASHGSASASTSTGDDGDQVVVLPTSLVVRGTTDPSRSVY
jgi:DNA-binding LacI/PurR family transcriptional regulator